MADTTVPTKTTLIVYTRRTESGKIEQGVTSVSHDAQRNVPSWADCYRAIPGFITGGRLPQS